MLSVAWSRFWDNIAEDVVLAIIGGAALGASEILFTGTIDLQTVAISGTAAGVVFVLQFVRCLITEPWITYTAQAAVISRAEARIDFSAILRVRKQLVIDMRPYGDGMDSLRSSLSLLQSIQETVVQLLHRPDCQWTHTPVGWGTVRDLAREWVGIAVVMEHRHGSGEITPIGRVYNDKHDFGAGPRRVIHPTNFPMARQHTEEVIGLLIREIEFPKDPFKREPDGAFVEGTKFALSFMEQQRL